MLCISRLSSRCRKKRHFRGQIQECDEGNYRHEMGEKMQEKIQNLLTTVRDGRFEMVDLKFSSLLGQWHHLTIPADSFNEETFSQGVAFDGSSIGFKTIKAGDMVLLPVAETAKIDPFWDVKTLSVICKAAEADTKVISSGTPGALPDARRNISRTWASPTRVSGARNSNSTSSTASTINPTSTWPSTSSTPWRPTGTRGWR